MGITSDCNDPDIQWGSTKNKGQNKKYLVLPEEARKEQPFIRPLRLFYIHIKCKSETRMNQAIAETYARNPKFYGSTFCVKCNTHLPVNEFEWEDGSKVGS